jgi:hypothetical protein
VTWSIKDGAKGQDPIQCHQPEDDRGAEPCAFRDSELPAQLGPSVPHWTAIACRRRVQKQPITDGIQIVESFRNQTVPQQTATSIAGGCRLSVEKKPCGGWWLASTQRYTAHRTLSVPEWQDGCLGDRPVSLHGAFSGQRPSREVTLTREGWSGLAVAPAATDK